MSNKLGRNVLSLGLSRIIAGGLTFYVYTLLASYLGPEDFGKFSLVLAYFAIFTLLSDLGVSRLVIKKVSENRELGANYLGNFFIVQLVLAVVAGTAFLLIPNLAHYDSDVLLAMTLTGVALFFTLLSFPSLAIIQAWQKIHIFAAVLFVDSLFKSAWFIYSIVSGKSLVFLFWSLVVIGLSDLLVYLFFARKLVNGNAQLRATTMKQMVVLGIPFVLVSGFEILIQKVDVVIQKIYLPFEAVGLYSAAYRFLDFLTFLPAIVAITLFPYFSSKVNLDDEQTRQTIERWNKYMVLLALPLGFAATLIANKIILTLFGEGYRGSILPFQILIWTTVLTLVYAVPGVMLVVKNVRRSILTLALATVFNILANLIFVPRYGIVASAIITTATNTLIAICYIWFAKQISKFSLFRFAIWPLLASLVMSLLLLVFNGYNLFVLVAVSLVSYFGLLVVVKQLTLEDWRFVVSAFSRQPAAEREDS